MDNDIVTLKVDKLNNETCDDHGKHLYQDETIDSNFNKDELKRISIANASEGDSLFKKKKKKKKGDKIMVQNYENMDNDIVTLKVDKLYNETCDDHDKQLYQNVTIDSNFNNDELKRISIANASEGDSLFKKKKKKKGDKIMVQNDENMDSDIVTLKVDKLYNETCDDHDKQLYQNVTIDSNFNKDELKRISIANASEDDSLVKELLKNKRRSQKKDIKAVTRNEVMSPKKQEYSKNDSPQSADMLDVETYYDSNNYIGEDSGKKLDLFDFRDDHTSEYQNMTDIVTYEKYPLQCDVCIKTFIREYDLYLHKRTHTKPYFFNVWGQSFLNTRNLIRHKRTHTGKKSYVCYVCDRSFSNTGNLTRHKRTHTGEKPYACNVCDQSFSQKGNLVIHIRTHTGEKPYVCNVCDLSFSQKGNLVIHKITHTGEQPYSCNVCGNSFSRKEHLVRHTRTHNGEKPYVCNICGNSFSRKEHLVIHERTHTGEKPYACDVCDQSFPQKGSLVTHKRTHTGEKPYSCKVCGRSFSQQGNLVIHFRSHTVEKPFECNTAISM
ncbi:zinc finger protein 391-like isoform X2 [Acyrthosiphon pisum]|nr:zinc finger protein 391-like isoform X2 [Acyrthosiphon pisum]XP_029344406.1 zinc finger protein 391-like isoform X2 [Acyrthosiphon pisum]